MIKHDLKNEKANAIYEALHAKFGVEWTDGIIFVYDADIYCAYDIPKQKLVHENVHIEQQKSMGAEAWWKKYFEEEGFRLAQEVEAYRKEWDWVRGQDWPRFQKTRALIGMCTDLASPIYGELCTVPEAKDKIQRGQY